MRSTDEGARASLSPSGFGKGRLTAGGNGFEQLELLVQLDRPGLRPLQILLGLEQVPGRHAKADVVEHDELALASVVGKRLASLAQLKL
jgi:hypothetical protein